MADLVRYRPAAGDDVAGIDRVVRSAYNALSRKHSFPEIPPGPPNPFYASAIGAEPEGCWVAERDGSVVGVSISSVRRPAWFLAYLFIDPLSQGQGVGRELMARALAHGGDAEIRTLVTLAYNPVSIGLYLRHGMYPLEPIYVLDAPVAELRQRRAGRRSLDSEVLAPDESAAECLAGIDEPILGMARAGVHRFLLQVPGNTCRIFRSGGAACAYAYVSASGRVGPVAAAAPLSFGSILETALRHATGVSQGRVSAVIAGSNMPALAQVTEHGMRITTPLLLMASRRFGDLGRYAFHSPGVM